MYPFLGSATSKKFYLSVSLPPCICLLVQVHLCLCLSVYVYIPFVYIFLCMPLALLCNCFALSLCVYLSVYLSVAGGFPPVQDSSVCLTCRQLRVYDACWLAWVVLSRGADLEFSVFDEETLPLILHTLRKRSAVAETVWHSRPVGSGLAALHA